MTEVTADISNVTTKDRAFEKQLFTLSLTHGFTINKKDYASQVEHDEYYVYYIFGQDVADPKQLEVDLENACAMIGAELNDYETWSR